MPKKIDNVELKKIKKTKSLLLIDAYPTIASELHPTLNQNLNEKDIAAYSHKKVWWRCSKHSNHEWQASIAGRTRTNSGCPICCNKVILSGYNDLATLNPRLASEWHPTKNVGHVDKNGRDISSPDKVGIGSVQRFWWMGSCGHEWKTSLADRVNGNNCPYCSNKIVLQGYNDLATTNPLLASEWHPTLNGELKPTDVTSGSGQKVWWHGKCGHEWNATVDSRNRGCECPYCSNQKVLVGYNDLATINPQLAAEWNYLKNGKLKPTDVLVNSNKKVWWKCSNGHEWQASIPNRNRLHRGCPYCSNQRVLPGYNDLATTHTYLLDEWDCEKNNVKPTQLTAGSEKYVWWKCKNGHSWKATVCSRKKGHGCPICNESYGEKSVRQVLLKNNTMFNEQNSFCDRRSSFGGILKDDFAILHNNCVIATIEYHGQQHYEVVDFSGHNPDRAKKNFEKIQIRDNEKTMYLKNHNIPQLIIPYWEFNNVEQIVTDFLKKLNLLI